MSFLDSLIAMKDGGFLVFAVFLVGMGAGIAGTLVPILLWLKVRVPAAAGVVLYALIPLIGLLGVYSSMSMALQAMATAPPELKQTMLAGGISISLYVPMAAGMLLPILAIPACWLSAGPAIRQEERTWIGPLIAGIAVLLCAVLPLFGLAMYASPAIAVARFGSAVFLGLPVAFALSATDRKGRVAAVVGACSFALAVAGGGLFDGYAGAVEVFKAVATAPPEMKTTLFEGGMRLVGNLIGLSWLPALAALGVAVGATARVVEPEDRPGAQLALVSAFTGLLLLSFDPGSLMSMLGLS